MSQLKTTNLKLRKNIRSILITKFSECRDFDLRKDGILMKQILTESLMVRKPMDGMILRRKFERNSQQTNMLGIVYSEIS